MYAARLIRTLDKFEASDFTDDADIRPKLEEVRVPASGVAQLGVQVT
jgi:hypothetical protein